MNDTTLTRDTPTAAELRHRMVADLTAHGAIRSDGWRAVFESVPRHAFIPAFTVRSATGGSERLDGADPAQRERWLATAYTNDSLVTVHDRHGIARSSSSQPEVMAFMLEALELERGHTVLEIGTGTGYNAALLSARAGDQAVTTVDISDELTATARDRLAATGYRPTIITADGLAGFSPRAPYDRIMATCSTTRVPAAWIEQTRPGGIVMANIGFGVVPLRVGPIGTAHGTFLSDIAAFMEARQADQPDRPRIIHDDALSLVYEERGRADQVADITWFPRGLTSDEFWFLFRVIAPGLYWFELPEFDHERRSYCLVDPATDSWYRVRTLQDGIYQVRQAGPRRLFDELNTTYQEWESAGRPTHDRLGLTATVDGTHTVWTDNPGSAKRWPIRA